MDPVDRLALFRAVKEMSPETLHDILSRAYGQNTRKTRSQTRSKEFDSYKCSNVARYLSVTNAYGENPTVVAEILAAQLRPCSKPVSSRAPVQENNDAFTQDTRDQHDDEDGGDGEIRDPRYLDTLECTTTRNLLSDVDFSYVPLDERTVSEPEAVDGECYPVTLQSFDEEKSSGEIEDVLARESNSEPVELHDLVRDDDDDDLSLCDRAETHEKRSDPVASDDSAERSTGETKKALAKELTLELVELNDRSETRDEVRETDFVTVVRDPHFEHGEKVRRPVVVSLSNNTAENRPSVVVDN